jgi:hypothetical protein
MKTGSKVIIFSLLISLLVTAVAAGCANPGKPQKKPQQQAGQEEQLIQINPGLAEKVKEKAKTVPGVDESVAVVIDKDISAAVKVSGFDRLRLKSIREEVHGKIMELAPGYEVHVTSDKKLFSELQKIETQINRKHYVSPSGIKSRVDKINNDMKG